MASVVWEEDRIVTAVEQLLAFVDKLTNDVT